MEALNITAFPEDASQIEAIKAFMKALKIKFVLSKEAAYDPDFVAMIKKGEKQIAEGRGIKMSVVDFKDLCK